MKKHKNKIFDEYLENIYDKDTTYNLIYAKINNKHVSKKKILNIAAILFVVIVLGTGTLSIYASKNWENEYKEYQNRYITSAKATVNTEIESENMQNLNMDYIYHDGIGVKINSLLLTDYTCQIDIDFKVIDNDKKNCNAFEFGFAIYDENNNIYYIGERTKFGAGKFLYYEKKLCKELGLKYNASRAIPRHITNSISLTPISINEGNNIMRLELKSTSVLPKTKKLYVRIFDIGYALANFSHENNGGFKIIDSEDFVLSDSEWQFEIEIPEKFYDKTYIELKLAEDIENIELEKAILSETNLSININTKYSLTDIHGISILDEYGNTYGIYNMSDTNGCKLIFNIENALDKKLYLNLNFPEHNINHKVELIKK